MSWCYSLATPDIPSMVDIFRHQDFVIKRGDLASVLALTLAALECHGPRNNFQFVYLVNLTHLHEKDMMF